MQNIEPGLVQRLPAILQKAEQIALVRQQLGEAAIPRVRLHQGKVLASRPSTALRSYQCRCSRHSLSGSLNRYVTSVFSTFGQRVASREGGRRGDQNPPAGADPTDGRPTNSYPIVAADTGADR